MLELRYNADTAAPQMSALSLLLCDLIIYIRNIITEMDQCSRAETGGLKWSEVKGQTTVTV